MSSAPPQNPGRRARRACDRCRIMRSKCSGGVRCSQCAGHDRICVYSDRKREQDKKVFAKNAQRIQQLEVEKAALVEALTDVIHTSEISPEERQKITKLLSSTSSNAPEGSIPVSSSSQSRRDTFVGSINSQENKAVLGAGEKAAVADLGSPGRQGELQYVVDLDHGAGMTGYVGGMSEVSWMQRAREYLVDPSSAGASYQTPSQVDPYSAQAFDLTYFMDDEDLLSVDEDQIVSEHLPSTAAALMLSEAYFHAVQGAFQFVERDRFLLQLEKLLKRIERPSWAQRRTLGLVNIVWAVGAKWLQITQLSGQTLAADHLIYYARARALGLDHRVLFEHPDVEMTQAIGVLGFYLLVNGSIQRSWSVIGHAIRQATALGLHLNVHAGAVDKSERENRARLWYSLFQVESLLSAMTGRSKCLRTAAITLSLFDPDHIKQVLETRNQELVNDPTQEYSLSAWQSFLGLHRGIALNLSGGDVEWDRFVPIGSSCSPRHFTVRVALSTISDEIGTKLYSGDTRMTWLEHQLATQALDEKLQNWHQSLPDNLAVDYQGLSDSDPRSRLELVMYYQSIRMILFRPFLREINIVGESPRSVDFNNLRAKACVEAAMHLLSAMPDNPIATEVFQILPWWSLLHYVCRAAAVLLLELCLSMQHMEGELRGVLSATRKALNYLSVLSTCSKSAYKALNILQPLFQRAQAPYRHDVLSDILMDAPEPRNWADDDSAKIEMVVRTLH